jgi:hypothetical protein
MLVSNGDLDELDELDEPQTYTGNIECDECCNIQFIRRIAMERVDMLCYGATCGIPPESNAEDDRRELGEAAMPSSLMNVLNDSYASNVNVVTSSPHEANPVVKSRVLVSAACSCTLASSHKHSDSALVSCQNSSLRHCSSRCHCHCDCDHDRDRDHGCGCGYGCVFVLVCCRQLALLDCCPVRYRSRCRMMKNRR